MEAITIPAEEAFGRIAEGQLSVDVRSEKEFAKGSFPSAINVPILSDEHRHLVGIAYKEKGSDSAVALGHELVDPLRPTLVEKWKDVGRDLTAPPLLFCWRGGMRSQIAADWVRESSGQVDRVAGGFQEIRRSALKRIENPPPLLVISGWTGSGKTEVFAEHPNFLDLEEAAAHRGSAFGNRHDVSQPTQLNFENQLAVDIEKIQRAFAEGSRHRETNAKTSQGIAPLAKPVNELIFVEDESRMVGMRHVPEPLYLSMAKAPCIFLDSPREERATRIARTYVLAPLQAGILQSELQSQLTGNVQRISKRLGNLLAGEVVAKIDDAFQSSGGLEVHLPWISILLEHYYDKSYEHALVRKERRMLFRGNKTACLEWLAHNPVV